MDRDQAGQRSRDSNRSLQSFRLETRYDIILNQGEKEWHIPPDPNAPIKRGRKKKSKGENLGERFRLHKTAILRFIRDDRVPFDNNLAEQDLRMMKVKQKVSGAFRTLEGSERSSRIRSFVSTLRKQKRKVLTSLIAIQSGKFLF
ncbi:IS66 family transposase [Shouchella shacheensis]|uniref:IS66 family transposase n=1 Tax=Shouchella shacheensis TaxID=1649580 RepID=UPI0009E92530